MRAFLRVLSAILLVQLSVTVNAQKLLQDADSLPLAKPKPAKPVFVFPAPGPGKVTLVHSRPISTDLPPPRKPFEGLLTLTTGISTSKSFSSNYLSAHEIKLDDPLKSWRVHLYCAGAAITDRERVKNDDGSFSLTKKKYVQLNWFAGGQGFLIEESDTVGLFLIIPDPSSDQQLAPWLTSVEQHYEVPVVAQGSGTYNFPPQQDYALYGNIRGKYFHVVVSGYRWVSLILLDEKPAGLFRSDFNDLLTTLKKFKIAPYVLVDKSLDEHQREDIMRLAMLTWLTTHSLQRSKYQK